MSAPATSLPAVTEPAGPAAAGDDAERYLTTADRIGWRICRDAIWSKGACNWLGWSTELVGSAYLPSMTALPAALYGGVAGVALFLARLASFTNNPLQRTTLQGATAALLAAADDFGGANGIGYFTGRSGIAYVLIEIGELTESTALVKKGIQVLKATGNVADDRNLIDLMNGYAGTIPALMDVAQRYEEDDLLDLAVRQAGRLVEWGHEDDSGVSWPSTLGSRHLTGYSHGAAGIGLALLEAFRISGDPRMLDKGVGAFRYERNLYDAAAENWPDLRSMPDDSASKRFVVAWCNGATGIGISRLRAAELLPGDLRPPQEADAAMRTAIKALTAQQASAARDFSYCHGLAGHADYLLQISQRLKRGEFRELADRLGSFGIAEFHEPGLPWPCGVPSGGETPALMIGTAGIGHFYLRLAATEAVPSVLIVRPNIEPPERGRSRNEISYAGKDVLAEGRGLS